MGYRNDFSTIHFNSFWKKEPNAKLQNIYLTINDIHQVFNVQVLVLKMFKKYSTITVFNLSIDTPSVITF